MPRNGPSAMGLGLRGVVVIGAPEMELLMLRVDPCQAQLLSFALFTYYSVSPGLHQPIIALLHCKNEYLRTSIMSHK